MPSSFTPSLRLTLPVTGENPGTWGDLVNNGITSLVDSSVAGYAAVTMTDANYTLTTANGAADEARRMMLNISGTLSGARNVICPTASKLYFVKNATTGGFAITLKTAAGSGVSIPNGSSMVLLCNGVNVVDAVTQFSSGSFINLAYTGTLTGGTGIVNLGSGQLYKDASGNVGIGTATPVNKFVVSNANANGIEFIPTSGNISSYNRTTSAYTQLDLLTNTFTVQTGTSPAERMRIDSAGNLLVGTTSAEGRIVANGRLQVGTLGQTDNSFGLAICPVTAADAIYNLASIGNSLVFSTGVNSNQTLNSERMRIDSAGNLAIGIATASARLTVQDPSTSSSTYSQVVKSAQSGNMLLAVRSDGYVQMEYTYNFLSSAAAANMVIGSGGYIFRSTSSAKYKRDIQTATYGLNEVMKLRPVTYRGKSEADGEKIFGGLIAEEVHAANLPEFVSYDKNNEPDALHYGHMVSLLTAAIQEQQALIASLTARVTALES